MRNFDSAQSGSGPVESAARTPEQAACEAESRPGVLVDVLPPNARIIVTTRNSRYRVVVIDAADRHVSIKGGNVFPDATEMLLEGATTDAGTIEPGWIRVGLPVTLSTGLRRITTSRVKSVRFERVSSATRAA